MPNYRTSKLQDIQRGRQVVENAFGTLSSRFGVLSDNTQVHPNRVKDIVLACVVLHNILWAERGAGGVRAERDLQGEEIPCGLEDGNPAGGNDRDPTNCPRSRNTRCDW